MGGCVVMQRAVLFPGQSRSAAPNAIDRFPSFEAVRLDTEFGPIDAWYQPAPGAEAAAPAPAVIFAHGNGELIDDWPPMLAPFAQLGVALMLVEYPGYGRSAGTPSEASVNVAMRAAWQALVDRPEVDPARIVLFGRSLGGGAVCDLLPEMQPAALILQSSFTSAADLAWDLFKMPSFVVRDPFRSLDAVRGYGGPVLVIHGRQDEMIPYAHAERMASEAPNGRLVTYECGHNDCPPDWPRFWRDVGAFLREVGVL